MDLLNLKIHSLDLEHLDYLLELDQVCFNGWWTSEGYRRELESPNGHFMGIFSPETDKLLGMGCFWSILEEAHITILAIHPQYQGQGLGQALLYYLLQNAVEIGLERATLEVRVSNQRAISLYQKFGFKIAGKRPRYYKDNQEDALILWRSDLHKPNFVNTLDDWEQMVCDRLAKSSCTLNNAGI